MGWHKPVVVLASETVVPMWDGSQDAILTIEKGSMIRDDGFFYIVRHTDRKQDGEFGFPLTQHATMKEAHKQYRRVLRSHRNHDYR